VRELTLQARAIGIDPRKKHKIHNLVLATPDLDVQVAVQRIAGDQLIASIDRFTIYSSPADKAIGASTWLFESPRGRVGTLGLGDLDGYLKNLAEFGVKHAATNFAVINFSGLPDANADRYGHSYFRDAPTVSSDLVLMLRDDLDPGPPGRPLERLGLRFWRIPPGYPRQPNVSSLHTQPPP